VIILPTLAIGLAIGYVVFRLPDIYESTTLIVVKSSTLPNSVVPMITEETLRANSPAFLKRHQPQFAATAG